MLMTKEIPLNSAFAVSQNPKALVWKWRQNWTFNVKCSHPQSLNAPISTNKAFFFKLTIEDYFKNYFGLFDLNSCRYP